MGNSSVRLDGAISIQWLIGGLVAGALVAGGIMYSVSDNKERIALQLSKIDLLTAAVTGLTIEMAKNTQARDSEIARINRVDDRVSEQNRRLSTIEGIVLK